MGPTRISDIFGASVQKCQLRAFEDICSVEEFHKILQRERDRADRSGLIFSVLIIDMESLKNVKTPVSDLIYYVQRRVRSTDTLGWVDERHLGVLLPDTHESGAWKLAEDICWQVSATIPALICKVYSYPSQELPLRERQIPIGNNAGNDSDRIESRAIGPDPPKTPVNGDNEFAGFLTRVQTHSHSNTPWEIHPFFVRRMPFWKRILDIIGALLALVLLVPLFMLIAAAIKIVSPGPVFFKQVRIGYLGRPFSFWKFRTMTVHTNSATHRKYMSHLINSDIPMSKLDSSNDPRMIPFGIFLRKTSLDELPQLINVLLGEMSLVGPRPCLPYEAQEYLRWHTRRFDSVPGMTGLWQISGKNRTTFKEMIRLDIKYERHMSIWLDIKILLKTLPTVVSMAMETFSTSKDGLDGGKTA